MKAMLPILLLALAAGSVTAQAAGTTPARSPLPAGDCIDTSRINEWHIVDDRTAIVRTGPKRYLVTMQSACPQLGTSPPELIFQANPSNAVVNHGRICGEVGETVRSRYQPPCAIQAVGRIDKVRFDQLSAQATRHGNGAERPAAMPAH